MNKETSRIFKNGILSKNPVFVQFVAIFPIILATSSTRDSLVVGISVAAILLITNTIVSLINKIVSGPSLRVIYLIIASGLTTVCEMAASKLYVPAGEHFALCFALTAVLCLAISSTCEFNNISSSFLHGLSFGISFLLSIAVFAAVREILSTGHFLASHNESGVKIFADWFIPCEFLLTPAGALILLGVIGAVFKKIHSTHEASVNKRKISEEIIERGDHEFLVKDETSGKIVRRSTLEKIAREEMLKNAPGIDDELIDDTSDFEFSTEDSDDDLEEDYYD